MEYSDIIRSRESIRNYDPDRPVPEKILEKILNAGRLAPSACNCQPWKFLLISSPMMLDKVRSCYPRAWFKEAPHVLVTVGYRSLAWVRSYDGYNSLETDVAIALTHIILAAENEGVATCWIAAYDPIKLKNALDLESNMEIFGITPLGYPKPGFSKILIKERKSLKEIVEFL
ncbi:MAG: nitroreductase family protein [Bacteroidales bacterium]|nr:nitroreductase family protein [Bacteroidales bacterium]